LPSPPETMLINKFATLGAIEISLHCSSTNTSLSFEKGPFSRFLSCN